MSLSLCTVSYTRLGVVQSVRTVEHDEMLSLSVSVAVVDKGMKEGGDV
jgi:hypothetical protein